MARQYPVHEPVRRVVRHQLSAGEADSRALRGAMEVLRMARDDASWELVAARARAGDRVAQHVLQGWPDPRGRQFFEGAFGDAPVDALPNPLSAVAFFVRCCHDHGLPSLVGLLGDPWTAGGNERIVLARNWVGAELNESESEGAPVSAAWIEYLASLLLSTPIVEEWGTLRSALALLRRHEDPRLPVVLWRLIHRHVDVDDEIVSTFTSARSRESNGIAASLADDLSLQAAGAKDPRRRERLERVAHLLRSSVG